MSRSWAREYTQVYNFGVKKKMTREVRQFDRCRNFKHIPIVEVNTLFVGKWEV